MIPSYNSLTELKLSGLAQCAAAKYRRFPSSLPFIDWNITIVPTLPGARLGKPKTGTLLEETNKDAAASFTISALQVSFRHFP